MRSKFIFSLTIFILIIFLSACGGSTEEKLHANLEKTVQIEESNENIQVINELEKQNKALLADLAKLTDQDFKEINKQSNELININEQLTESLKSEKEFISKTKKEFKKNKSLIEKMEENKKKETGLEMYNVMNNRYDTYDKFVDEYLEVIKKRHKLIELIRDENSNSELFFEQLEAVNNQSEQTLKLNQELNKQTKKYNTLKKKLYDQMDLNVKYNDEESN
ncbi:MAG TPA: YkyA family protein [Pseudogracilibacillus sp.]|nr:YkyA family protein [Pseudogracilibacillus sp.]